MEHSAEAMAPPAEPPFALSLVRDDVAYRAQRRLGLIPAQGLGLGRRLVFWSMLAWLPIAIAAALGGRALTTAAGEPLLAHFGIHVRFLVAVPLFILAEGALHALTMRLLPHFVTSGIVPEAEVPRLRAALTRVAGLRNSTLPWIAIFAVVLAGAAISSLQQPVHEVEWALDAATAPAPHPTHLGFGGWWFLLVGRPIYLTLLLSWLWRAVLLAMLFRAIARLDLAIVPTHPDGAGGLGFLERFPTAFAPVVLAISATVAASWAHGVVYHGVAVESLRLQMAAAAILVLLIFLSPMLMFAGVLRATKRQALLDYGALVGRHGRLVQRRWIQGLPVTDDAVLGAPELGPVADTIALFGAVKDMRTMPMGKASVAPLILAAIIPMLVVLAIQIPVKDILRTLVGALL